MNILSYQLGTVFKGQIINSFLKENTSKEAKRLTKHYIHDFNSNSNYILVRQQFRTNDKPRLGFIKLKEDNNDAL